MAGIFNEDDSSTDDEIGVNLQLAERLRINRENGKFLEDTSLEDSKEIKQICNMHRKKFAQTRNSSSSSSVEVPSDNPPGMSSDSYHNKKRQNVEQSNVEQLDNPKRTCLSDRFSSLPEWQRRDPKRKEKDKVQSKHSFSNSSEAPSVSSPDLFPRKRHDYHVNSLAESDDSDFETCPAKMRNYKKTNGHGHNSKSSKNYYSGFGKKGHINLEKQPSTSYSRNTFLESGSDEEPILQNGALKGGRPESSENSYAKRLFGRKVNRQVLDSDESNDDSSVALYRSKPLIFSSSDSESDFRQAIQSKQALSASSNLSDISLPYDNGCGRNSRNPRHCKVSRPNQKFHKKTFNSIPPSIPESAAGCDRQFHASDFQSKTTPSRSCRTRRSPRINIAANISTNCIPNKNSASAPVRGRRTSGGDRRSRRAGSPHQRSHLSQNRSDDCHVHVRSASSRSQNNLDLATRYPDMFTAEESENEFFTANSYSDTETSTESLNGVTINASFPSQRGSTISCSIEREGDGTTDDEIIVLYSAGPYGRTNEVRRGGARTFGRRLSRGTPPHRQLQNTQEIVSLSPDPVEQVRQMEEDERMARMLQAQFDAEVDPRIAPRQYPTPCEEIGERDLVDTSDTDSEEIDPVGYSDSELTHHPFEDMSPSPTHYRLNRFPHRGAPVALGMGFQMGNRRYNGRRMFQIASRDLSVDFHIASLFGVPHAAFLEDGNDYEALLNLDLDGEVMQRGLHKSDINRLPTRKYIHPNSESSSAGTSQPTHKRTALNKECQVCLTDYETGDILRILPCFHEFHTPCIDPWLKINHTCPVCRVRVDLDS